MTEDNWRETCLHQSLFSPGSRRVYVTTARHPARPCSEDVAPHLTPRTLERVRVATPAHFEVQNSHPERFPAVGRAL